MDLHKTENAEDLAQDRAVVHDDGSHGIVFGLETDVAVFLIEGLYGGFLAYQSHDDLSVLAGLAGVYKDQIAVKDTGIDHGLAVDPESVGFAGGNVLCGNGEVGIDVLLGQDGLTGSNSSYHGDRDHLGAYHLEAVVTDLNRPGLCGISADIAVLFQSLQMGMDGRSGTEIDRRTDLAY